jgi:GGDEF domain-containing protein
LSLASKPSGSSPRAALDDALRTAARLVRAEDMMARLTSTTLIFMLRGTGDADAQRVARRLEGVISGTHPRSTADQTEVHAASIERAAGVEIEGVIAALVADLRERRTAPARTSA